MKHLVILNLVIFMLFTACESSDNPSEKEEGVTFLLLQKNSQNQLAKGAAISILEVSKKGESTIETLAEIYPSRDLWSATDVAGGRIAIGLHTDFNVPGTTRQTNGGWLDITSNSWHELPLLPTNDENRYNYFDVSSPKVSENGYVFFLSSSNARWYHDQYRASLVRYDPVKDELITASNPTGFVLQQPEKGWDTEAGQFVRQFYPSKDGRYVYGVIEAFGVDGGAIHWDYKILFKYDFQTNQYTRLGDAEDRQVIIMGITADKKNLAYISTVSNASKRKIVNTGTNITSVFSTSGGQAYSNTSRWNSNGYCSGETNNTIGIYNMVANTKHDIKTQSRPYYAQFGPDGDVIYYMIETGKGNFLCKTSNLTSTATIDTVCTLPSNIVDFLVIK
jgi:hypothetical protein